LIADAFNFSENFQQIFHFIIAYFNEFASRVQAFSSFSSVFLQQMRKFQRVITRETHKTVKPQLPVEKILWQNCSKTQSISFFIMASTKASLHFLRRPTSYGKSYQAMKF